MKKLLGAVISLALLIPSGPVSAELFKNVALNGSLDVRATSAINVLDMNTAANDHIGTVQNRTLLNLTMDLLDDVHSTISLRKNDRTWGTVGAAGGSAVQQNNQSLIGSPNANNDIASNIFVQQANVKIDKVFGGLDVKIGRQYYGEPDDFVIHFGPKNWYGLAVTAVDAVRLDNDNQYLKWSGLVGQTAGCVNNGTTALGGLCANQDIVGVDTWIKNLPIQFGPFIWNRQTHAVGNNGTPGGKNDNFYLYGARLKAEGMGAWVQAEIGINAGENRLDTNPTSGTYGLALGAVGGAPGAVGNYQGKAIEIKAGYKADLANVASFAPWLTLAYGSGRSNKFDNQNKDFQSITNSPSYGFINGYFNNLSGASLGSTLATAGKTYDSSTGVSTLGDTNREIFGIGLKSSPASLPKLTVGVGLWDFWYQHATTLAKEVSIAAGNRHIGSEIDIMAEWKHSDNVSLVLNLGDFMPGGFIYETAKTVAPKPGVNSVRVAMLDTRIKF